MDFQQLVTNTETACEALSVKADSVIKLWGTSKELSEKAIDNKALKSHVIATLWDVRNTMQTTLGRLSFEMGMLHSDINNALSKLGHTEAKQALLERVLKHLIQTQEVINRAQGAADMVSIMLQDAVSG